MSDMAKSARAAMKAKAKRLGEARSAGKVSSSDWTPPEELNADVKTGMRPVSRRAFKKGGKVMGDCNAPRADRKPRKAGGKAEYKAEATEFANAKVNRNVKAANEDREGKKHIGGMKKGGRAQKNAGGDAIGEYLDKNPAPARAPEKSVPLPPPRPKNLDKPKEPQADITDPKNWPSTINSPRKSGGKVDKKTGRAKKMMGGPMMNPNQMMGGITPAAMGGGNMGQSGSMVGPDPRMGMVSPKSMEFGQNVVTPGLKKGGKVTAESEDYKALRQKGGTQVMKKGGRAGKAGGGLTEGMKRLMSRGSQMPRPSISQEDKEADALREQGRGVKRLLGQMPRAKGGKVHKDEAMDKALIKKMVKPEARKGKNIGGMLGGLIPMAIGAMSGKDKDEKKHGGRTARKAGGRTKAKGKTNINIMISAGKPEAPGIGPMDMPPPPMGGPGAAPIPLAMPKAPGPQAAPMPMPIPMPMPMAGGAPGGAPPMPRKTGGRVSKVAKSYKDMEAGAGSGEGRLQKTDIAKRQPKPGFQKGDNVYEGKNYPNAVPGATGGRTAKKKGGKVYKSYKDMDAGAGSGVGRLEKTEIASRHH